MIKKFYYPREEKEYYIYYYSNTDSPIPIAPNKQAFDVQVSRNELSDFTDFYGNTYNCRYVFTQPPTSTTPYLGGGVTDFVRISLITYTSSRSFINSIVTIGNESFFVGLSGEQNLTTVVLPNSLENIGGASFEHRNALATIYYNGTEAEWDAINFGSDWADGISSDAVLYYIGGSKPIP